MEEKKLPIIILLVNDSAYGNIRQEELYKMGVNRYTGVDFPDIDYLNVAKALGVDGCIVRKASEIPAAFARARNSGKTFHGWRSSWTARIRFGREAF